MTLPETTGCELFRRAANGLAEKVWTILGRNKGESSLYRRAANNKSVNSPRLFSMDFPQLSSYNEMGAPVSNILTVDQTHFILFELQ